MDAYLDDNFRKPRFWDGLFIPRGATRSHAKEPGRIKTIIKVLDTNTGPATPTRNLSNAFFSICSIARPIRQHSIMFPRNSPTARCREAKWCNSSNQAPNTLKTSSAKPTCSCSAARSIRRGSDLGPRFCSRARRASNYKPKSLPRVSSTNKSAAATATNFSASSTRIFCIGRSTRPRTPISAGSLQAA